MVHDSIAFKLQAKWYKRKDISPWLFLGNYATIEDAHKAGLCAQEGKPHWEFRVIDSRCNVVDSQPSPQE